MPITTEALIAKFQQALTEKWGYIYGSAGGTWTKAKQAKATREQTVKWGSKWIGKRVADCSGLFSWAFKQLGGSIAHGSNFMWSKYTVNKGKLVNGKRDDGEVLKPGSAVFKVTGSDYHHVGLYIGDGKVIEAKGTYYGVCQSDVKSWHAWAELKGVAYITDSTDETKEETAMNGDCIVTAEKGDAVNVRAKAGTSSAKLAALAVGTKVTVLEDDGTWCKIQYTNTGYMMSQFLKEDK